MLAGTVCPVKGVACFRYNSHQRRPACGQPIWSSTITPHTHRRSFNYPEPEWARCHSAGNSLVMSGLWGISTRMVNSTRQSGGRLTVSGTSIRAAIPGLLQKSNGACQAISQLPADYDGDGFTDYAVWRPSTATWFILPSRARAAYSVQWGFPDDIPVTGDFDGDAKADLAVWRPSNQTWYLRLSGKGSKFVYQWGLPGDVPVSGDFDGSGKQEMAVWRPSNGIWYVVSASRGIPFIQQWGLPGDVPVTGDF
jgi:hypothetical protein